MKGWVLGLGLTALAVACGCSEAGGPEGTDAGIDSAVADSGLDATSGEGGAIDDGGDASDGSSGTALIERGRYLAWHVSGCVGCHTPRNPDGSLDETVLLGGVPVFLDLVPGDDSMGAVPSPNISSSPSGLGSWSDDEIEAAITAGRRIDGSAILAVMPYWLYQNMAAEDLDAIVAYLRSVEPVDQVVGDRQPLGFPVVAAAPVPEAMIPQTTLDPSDVDYERAQRGRYLATMAGRCIECHTQPAAGPIPIDLTMAFAGSREFTAAELLLPSPPFPTSIYSANITPDATGVQGWSAAAVRTTLKLGIDIDGQGICPPMPVGPMGDFGGLTDEDALAIGTYVTTLPPIANDRPADCVAPELPPPGDGGVPDGG